MRRRYRKRRKRYTVLDLVLYILLIAVICSFGFIYYFNKILGPGLIECAENEMRRLTILVMNNSFEKYLRENEISNLLEISRNQDNQIELIQYNTKLMNEITGDIVSILERDLYYMTKGDFEKLDFQLKNITDQYYEMMSDGILFTVSVGSATGNSLLANIGPKIPLNLSLVGEVLAEVETEVMEYGLNNVLMEVFIQIEVSTVIHMPFMSKKITVENKIPLTMEMIQGEIPGYYLENLGK